ncbi:hypothetical protein BDFB_006096 [Asbolus verrucosus]|uniref:Uncharacterized protein n=1 Tax=Asbolus verrucosus TaxID=1661398 RepID=A0A482V169_ASBVE|nr:hypothetical protein BDFB_006096 [Asbolus verrucosus]
MRLSECSGMLLEAESVGPSQTDSTWIFVFSIFNPWPLDFDAVKFTHGGVDGLRNRFSTEW